MRLLKVALPEIKAPIAPTNGAISGQEDPRVSAMLAANSIGMLSRPIWFTPELIKIRTSGTAAPSAMVLEKRFPAELERTVFILLPLTLRTVSYTHLRAHE